MLQDDFILGNDAISWPGQASRSGGGSENGPPIICHLLKLLPDHTVQLHAMNTGVWVCTRM